MYVCMYVIDLWKFQPFNHQKWLTCNFSLLYPYTIQQTGKENTQTQYVAVFFSWSNTKFS